MFIVCCILSRNRCFSGLSAEQQAAAMLSSVRRAVRICQWRQQKQQQQQQQQQGVGCSKEYGGEAWQQCRRAVDVLLPSAKLLVELMLLVPTADMASSCLQLITALMQQVNAALQLASDEANSYGKQLSEGICNTMQTVLVNLGPAVCHCGKQTNDLKLRRQLLRLWADAVAMLMQANTGKT
jgi:hypothetical protein